MKKAEAVNLVLNKQVDAIGAKELEFVDCLKGVVLKDCFLDLADQDHNPVLLNGDLVMDLWFSAEKIGNVPAEAVLDSQEVHRPYGKVVLNKLRVKVDLDRVYVDGRRIYVED